MTVVTQIGGILWCLSLLLRGYLPKKNRLHYKILLFPLIYIIFTFLVIPPLAYQFGRTPLPILKSSNLSSHSYFTIILNRHYVTPILKEELIHISYQFEKSNPTIKTIYLDANFPFWDGFPLLPHLSHNDGKKIDLSFQYSQDGKMTNKKPSRTGYGVYEHPKSEEINQPERCLDKGYWQYDFPKYLTLGSSKNLHFEESKTKELIDLILKRKLTDKVFIEPHLKSRMKIDHSKLRYHGCRAVRHDDHIHYQIR